MSAGRRHACSPSGAARGFRCCMMFPSIKADCDRCEGDGCAQCQQAAVRLDDEIMGELLRYAPKPWKTEAGRDNG